MKTDQMRFRPLVASAMVGLSALLGGCGGGDEGNVTIEIPEGSAPPPATAKDAAASEDTGGGVMSGDPSMYTK